MSRRRRRHSDHGRGRPRSLTTPPRGVPWHGRRGVAVALALHSIVLAGMIGADIVGRLGPDGRTGARTGPGVVVTFVDAAAAAAAAPQLEISGPQISKTSVTAVAEPFPPSPGIAPFDTSRIEAKRNELFPFLTSRMAFLERLRTGRKPSAAPAVGALRAPAWPVLPPLSLSPEEFDAITDRTWSRRERWRNLAPIVTLADRHHPDDGQLPALVRSYVERNLLQPYFPARAPDARFWIVLGMASDHGDVLRYVSRYAGEHPYTRATTELLFLLDQLVEASHDAFKMLLLTPLESLGETARLSPANAALARRLQEGYGAWAQSLGVLSTEDLDRRIGEIRLEILSTIIEASPNGYGTSDAQFLIGRMLWTSGDREGAAQRWSQMRHDGRDSYARAKTAIASALRADGRVDETAIVDALDMEQERWLRTATRRLARFGFEPSTY